MLAIGRALMGAPDLLLLDEPSLGLAPIVVATVFETLKRLNDAGLTILLVEQNARRALAIADYAYVMERGRIVDEGRERTPAVRSEYPVSLSRCRGGRRTTGHRAVVINNAGKMPAYHGRASWN